ncbi:MAG: hypothetical protein MSC31_02235 [Solirubrobacteraceae bacterium MAG38_C4-C5]|nr:hypothetical protein [Candidatus Siliceabacter maunaloa]
MAGATLAGALGAALTRPIADARPKGDIDGALAAWSGQWLGALGERLGPYAAQRAIVWAVVAAAVLGVAAIVRRRAGGAGPSPRAVLAGLCAGALAGLASAGMSPSALALAVQAGLVVGAAAAVALVSGVAGQAARDPATLPPGAAPAG